MAIRPKTALLARAFQPRYLLPQDFAVMLFQ